MDALEITERTRVRRLPKRGAYDTEKIYSILDEAFLCHLGFVVDGQPYVIPTAFARSGDTLYVHGSAASRIMRLSKPTLDVCVTVTLLDGLVLARSAFHHSMNYRSVMVIGNARLVADSDEKREALLLITDHIVPGRSAEVRLPTDQETKATGVLALAIEEASAKIRTGPPIDDDEDYSLPVWAGVVPVRTEVGSPIGDERVLEGINTFDVGRLALRGSQP